MTGLNLSQFKALIIAPTLDAVGLGSPAAINLVTGTACVESDLTYLHQLGTGPALGLFQMEPATHDWLWTLPSMASKDSSSLGSRIAALSGSINVADDMVWNLRYAALMCRVRYLASPQAMCANSAAALAAYWKSIYNTGLGAGTVDAAHIAAFQAAMNA